MTALSSGVTNLSYSGAAVIYTIPTNGQIDVKLWGAAGGSNSSAAGLHKGGSGGWTLYSFLVQAGDSVKFEIGGGGARNDVRTGGFPDGGTGQPSSSQIQYNGSGGGGSTRVWLDVGTTGTYVLMAVAGGGGGLQTSFASTPTFGGAGGGSSGLSPGVTVGANNRGGGPGTQSAGGAIGVGQGASLAAGASLRGGTDTSGTLQGVVGGGGGGGFFGGGMGGGNGSNNDGSGGGGSGYINTAHARYVGSSGTTTAGVSNGTTSGTTDVDYPTSPANVGTAVVQAAGGNGYAHVNYSAGSPGTGTGDVGTATMSAPAAGAVGNTNANVTIGTVTMSAPAGSVATGAHVDALQGPLIVTMADVDATVGISPTATGNVGTITVTTPDGFANSIVNASGIIRTINVECDLVAGPEVAADVIIDLLFEIDPVALSTVEGSVEGAAVIPKVGNPPLDIGTAHISPVDGFYTSVDAETGGSVGSITVTPFDGLAAQALASPFLRTTHIISLLEADSTGAADAEGNISIFDHDGHGGIQVGAVTASVHTPDVSLTFDLETVTIPNPVFGIATNQDTTFGIGGIGQVDVSQSGGELGHGSGAVNVVIVGPGSTPQIVQPWGKVTVSNIVTGHATGIAEYTAEFDLTITFAVPVGITQSGQNILAPIGRVILGRALGGAGDNPSFEAEAIAQISANDIIVTNPAANFAIDGNATGDVASIILTPPEGEGDPSISIEVDLPGPVVLVTFDGNGGQAISGGGDLSTAIILQVPAALVAAVASGFIPTIVIKPTLTAIRSIPVTGIAVISDLIYGTVLVRTIENGVGVVESVIDATAIIRD